MSEFMGLIRGMYEAKQEGFLPGGEPCSSSLVTALPAIQFSGHEVQLMHIMPTPTASCMSSVLTAHFDMLACLSEACMRQSRKAFCQEVSSYLQFLPRLVIQCTQTLVRSSPKDLHAVILFLEIRLCYVKQAKANVNCSL